MISQSQGAVDSLTGHITKTIRQRHARIATMPPRRTRNYQDTPASRELDVRIAHRDKLERQLLAAEESVWEQVVVTAREKDSKITVAELARRVGYSREHVSKLISEANKRDGWVKPKAD